MPGEFVASPRDPFSSQPIAFSRSHAQAQASKDSMSKDVEAQGQPRPSLESLDSIAQQKQSAESSSPQKPSIRSALHKARRKLSSSGKDRQVLAGSEEEFEKQKQKEIEMAKRTEEYEKFNLKDKVNYMQMNG
ncbi:hypothetical protein K505DRAFT_229748 [Melanomma pulvis-pyrius CBS 109.77]|uniref:Uncharacterized protein n=1 Tax=Melanomma pulvis-pyrius CBS 109.77 TaxID=1314802 RepID=A0A6A6XUT1_9PLEO|nr:hypothetical protein K505DRAFT_229748 [Melanomma pulvis-pyrius CBS 109.77]